MQAAPRSPSDHIPLRDAQVTIVGLGLMGGSLAAALKQANACRRVVGVVRRRGAAALALEREWVDEASRNLADVLPEADLVVLATPVRTILELLPGVGNRVRPGCLVMDLGSTKAVVTQALRSLPEHVMVVGGHPMCGKEASGIEAAEASLFEGQVFVLTPLRRTRLSALALARERETGSLESLIATPVCGLEYLGGKLIAYVTAALAGLLPVWLTATLLFGVPFRGSLLLLVVLTADFLLASVGMALFIGSLMGFRISGKNDHCG